jgi:hypothetical protein
VQTVVGGVAPESAVPRSGERAARQVPVRCAPCRPPSARRLERLARGAPLDTWDAVALWPPGARDSQQGQAPPHAGREPTATPAVGRVGGDLEGALGHPLWELPVQPCRLVLLPEGAAPLLGVPTPQSLATPVRLHPLGTPHVQRVMPRHLRQDG